VTLLGDSVRYRRSDLRWFARWPLAVLTGRFPRHEGHFDPGQRIMNLVVVVLLLVLVGSGVGLTQVVGGPAFVWLARLHRWVTAHRLWPAWLDEHGRDEQGRGR
jgi:cytochrome b subunit of formate dehydrogenase